jgi:Flp pilus assembly protein CpaB
MKDRVLLIVALVTGVAAAGASFFFLQSASESTVVVQGDNAVEVLFTKRALSAGTQVRPEDLGPGPINPNTMPGLARGAVRASDLPGVSGQTITVDAPAGVPLLYAYLLATDSTIDAKPVGPRPGYRALAFDIEKRSLVGSTVAPGALVDVYVGYENRSPEAETGGMADPDGVGALRDPDDIMSQALTRAMGQHGVSPDEWQVEVVASAITVLMVTHDSREVAVTLEVTPEQARDLLAAEAGGANQLTLALCPQEVGGGGRQGDG